MARKMTRGLALTDIANRINAGTVYQFSALEQEGKLLLFHRVAGTVFWQPVNNERKKGQIAYNLNSLAALIRRIATLSRHFEFSIEQLRFSSAALADPFEVRLAAKWAELPLNQQEALLRLLEIPVGEDCVSAIAAKVMYQHESFDPLTLSVFKTFLPWPEAEQASAPAGNAADQTTKTKPTE